MIRNFYGTYLDDIDNLTLLTLDFLLLYTVMHLYWKKEVYLANKKRLLLTHVYVTGFAKTWHNHARTEIHFMA